MYKAQNRGNAPQCDINAVNHTSAISVRQKILMTAFHFPPQAGSSGMLRTLNFVRYLPANGWDPIVLTAHQRAYETTRDDLIGSIPQGVDVFRAQAIDAAKHLSIGGKYLLATALPDRWASWWADAVRIGKKIITKRRPDVLWSTYPLATTHMINSSLAKWSRIPWVADFRDPMVTDTFPTHHWQRHIYSAIEGRVLGEASLCVFTTENSAALYQERYPDSAKRCIVIANGYDEESFQDLSATRTGVDRNSLLMLHSGLMYPEHRNPEPFFRAVQDLIQQGVLDRKRICIRFRASMHEEELYNLAARQGVQDIIDIAPPIPYRDALAEMMGSDLLLVFQGSAFNAQIPAKIYEYMRTMRPILGMIDPCGNTASELSKFSNTYQADIQRTEDISKEIEYWLRNRFQERGIDPLGSQLEYIRTYSRQYQARLLAAALNMITSRPNQYEYYRHPDN